MLHRYTSMSIRARQAIATLCLERHCSSRNISHSSIDQLTSHLWRLASSTDLPGWQAELGALPVSGSGDPLPEDLASVLGSGTSELERLLEYTVEVSLSQFYGATNHHQSTEHLKMAIEIAKRASIQVPHGSIFAHHQQGSDGWGDAIDAQTLSLWRSAA